MIEGRDSEVREVKIEVFDRGKSEATRKGRRFDSAPSAQDAEHACSRGCSELRWLCEHQPLDQQNTTHLSSESVFSSFDLSARKATCLHTDLNTSGFPWLTGSCMTFHVQMDP